MRSRLGLGLVVALVTLAVACTSRADEARADPNAAVRKTVRSYLQAEAKADYAAMWPLFTEDAQLKYIYQWGGDHKDTVYEYDLSKMPPYPDDTFADILEGYETLDRKQRIVSIDADSDGKTVVVAAVAERYRYQGYKGTAKTTLKITLEHTRIARLTSTTRF